MWKDLDRTLRALVMKVGAGVYTCYIGTTKYKVIIMPDYDED